MEKQVRLYRPSNGTEGEAFIYNWCRNCIYGAYEHTGNPKQACEIVTLSMCHYVTDPEYPKEWRYNDDGKAVCTKFVKWDWGNDGDPNDPNNPKAPIPEDPNQLVMPFILEDSEPKIIDINEQKKKEIISYVLEYTKSF